MVGSPVVGSMARISTAPAEPCGLTDEIHTPVDAVGLVDIDVARRPEHHRIAGGRAAIAVRCGIGMMVSLDLDDPAADAVDKQRHPDQFGRDLVHAALEEGSGQPLSTYAHRRRPGLLW